MAPVADRHEIWGRGVYPKSKMPYSFQYLGLRIIFHLSLYLYPKVVFRYIGWSIRFRQQ